MSNTTEQPDASRDKKLFSVADSDLQSIALARGRSRLRSYITIRWIAIAGQSLTVLVVRFGFGIELPLAICGALIALSVIVNLSLLNGLRRHWRIGEGLSNFQLFFDVVQLASLIAVTGGLSNPFLMLLIAPVTVASVSLRRGYAISLSVTAFVLAAGMLFFSEPLPFESGAIEMPKILQYGHLIALGVGLSFFSVSAARVSADESKLVRALDATQVVLAREQRLSALGALSAMTAHQLGTPLATIHLAAKEISRGLLSEEETKEDINIIVEQAERCREILLNLSQSRDDHDEIHARMTLMAILEEASTPHKGQEVEIELAVDSELSDKSHCPEIARRPEVLHALGAFIENAVSFADTTVKATARWDENAIAFKIIDDGPGFAFEILGKLGEPYVSQRSDAQKGGSDLGLGFFIAKTLIERTGGTVITGNLSAPESGAVVEAIWPRTNLEFFLS